MKIPKRGKSICNLCDMCSVSSDICVDDYRITDNLDIMVILSSLPYDVKNGLPLSASPTIHEIENMIKEVYPKFTIGFTSVVKCQCFGKAKPLHINTCVDSYFKRIMQRFRPKNLVFLGAQAVLATLKKKNVIRGAKFKSLYGNCLVAGTWKEITENDDLRSTFKADLSGLTIEKKFSFDNFKINIAQNRHDLEMFMDELETAKILHVDIESSTLKAYKPSIHPHRLLSVSFTHKENEAFVIPVDTLQSVYKTTAERDYAVDVIRYLMSLPMPKDFHNGKHDISYMAVLHNIVCNNYSEDTMYMAYLLNERQDKGLKDLSNKFFPDLFNYDRILDDYKLQHPDANPDKDGSYLYIPNSILLPYNGVDTIATHRYFNFIKPTFDKDWDLVWIYRNILLPVTLSYMKMECAGILIDRKALEKEGARLKGVISECLKQLSKFLISKGLPVNINLNAPEQIAATLLKLKEVSADELKVTALGKYSCDEKLINKLINRGSFVAKLINKLRKATSMESKYAIAFLKAIDLFDRLHSEYGITTTDTGRSSSYDPNMQNVTKKYRVYMIASTDKKRVMFARDFSQLEIRLMASVANVKLMLEIYKRNGDIHKLTAASAKYDKVKLKALAATKDADKIIKTLMDFFNGLKDNKKLRQQAKAVNFHFLYRGSPDSLADRINVDIEKNIKDMITLIEETDDENEIAKLEAKIKEARESMVSVEDARMFYDVYFVLYPEIKEYHKKCEQEALTTGMVRSPFGRIKHLPEAQLPDSIDNFGKINHALNAATNHKIQSPGSDLKFLSLIEIDKQIELHGYNSFPVAEVHDDITLDCDSTELLDIYDMTEVSMDRWHERFDWLLCPIVSDAKVGFNWCEMEELKSKDDLIKWCEKNGVKYKK